MGATLYLEASATLDLDVFVALPTGSGEFLVSLSGICQYLMSRGCKTEGEYIIIGSWPVQFLAPGNPLEQEAIAQAREAEVEGVRTWVMSAEHLLAIALRTGRAKDHARILQFLEQNAVDAGKLTEILARHGLAEKWTKFRRKYLDE